MRKAAKAPLDELLSETVKVIERLLTSSEAANPTMGYCGNTSNKITGYEGVKVYLLTSRYSKETGLYIEGPQKLLDAVRSHYGNRDFEIGRAPGRLAFAVHGR